MVYYYNYIFQLLYFLLLNTSIVNWMHIISKSEQELAPVSINNV